MSLPSTFSARAVAALFALMLFAGSAAQAATFSVDPILVTLDKGGASASVAITNQSPGKLRLQITGFAWQQSAAGEMQLNPTDDLIFFPQLLVLDPGETRRVRVGTSAQAGPTEKSYRVFMEELPSLESVTKPKGASVTIRMKIGIPVFVSPTAPAAVTGTVRDASARDGSLSFDVVNTGNTHFAIQQVKVQGKNAAGNNVLNQDLSGWYVLAGGTRHYTLPLSKEHCAELHSLAIQVNAGQASFAGAFPDSKINKQCGAASHR